jgi:hypothetical protein
MKDWQWEQWALLIGALAASICCVIAAWHGDYGQILGIITALTASYAAIKGHQAQAVAKEVKSDLAVSDATANQSRAALKEDIQTVKKEINGAMAAALKEHGESEFAKGVLKGSGKMPADPPLPPPPTPFNAH